MATNAPVVPLKIEDGSDASTNKMAPDEFKKISIRDPTQGPPVSGRPWKLGKTQRTNRMAKHFYAPKTLDEKKASTDAHKRMKAIEKAMKQEKLDALQALRDRRKLNEERRKANELKAQVVQKITNTKKLKKLSKKQWRSVETR
eukprot:TRINITY_DN851_c0_g1_i1.p2 TRINITY_DN851_c0_g1~~TRINITY_DN851_c0_g1_i1.p2  ORF type:complete len:144 (-),score=70.35 TRINITY_DN851_c0_g1_i1:151-582(-)